MFFKNHIGHVHCLLREVWQYAAVKSGQENKTNKILNIS